MFRRLLRHLRALLRVEPRRPALWAGLRAALAAGLPLVLGVVSGLPNAGWAGLTAFLVTVGDRGGSYLQRARAMGALTVLGAAAGAVGALGGVHLGTDVALLLVGLTATGFARCYGETAGAVGGQIAVVLVVSLGAPSGDPGAAAVRAAAFLAGGLWGMALSLLLWPLHPFRPARHAIARVYDELAEAAEGLGSAALTPPEPAAWLEALQHHARLRPSIEEARTTLAATRLGRPSESPRGAHLVVLVELSEPTVAVLLALAEAVEVASREPRLRAACEQVERLCGAYAMMARWIARALREPRRDLARAPSGAVPPSGVRRAPVPLPAHLSELLSKLREYSGAAHETAASLLHGDAVSERGWRAVAPPGTPARSLVAPVRDHLARDSLVLRHALRVALTATVGLLAARALGLRDTHWVSLTVVGILQPYSASTEERALQRTAATLLGASLAALLATVAGSPAVLAAIAILLTAVSVSLLPLNFSAFQLLLTPDYLLLTTLSAGSWSVGSDRIQGVLLAGALSLAGAWLLWPSPERRRFPDAAATALHAGSAYLREVAERQSGTAAPAAAARRTFSLALLDAEASFQRLLAEHRGPAEQLEPGMALLTWARRLNASVAALGAERPRAHAPGALPRFGHEARRALDALADAVRVGRPPPPLPALPLPPTTDDPLLGTLLERFPRQLGVLHGAVTRLSLAPALR